MEESRQVTVCTLDCPDACSLVIRQDKDGTIIPAGNPGHPVTRGFICPKIRKHLKRLTSPDRVTTPLKRGAAGFQEIGWEEALDLCAEKIREYRSQPSSILYFHGEGGMGALKNMGNLFFSRLGASLVRGSLCDSAGISACMKDFGSRDQNDITELANASAIVNWGKDLSRSSVHTAYFAKQARKKGARLTAISPGGDGNASYADTHIRIRPGTDRFLAAAVIRLFIDRCAVGEDIIAHTANWDGFRKMMMQHNVEDLLHVCEVSRDEAEDLYETYVHARPVSTLIGAGLQRYSFGGENVRFINALAMVSGNIGLNGAGICYHLLSSRNLSLDWATEAGVRQPRLLRKPMIARDILAAADPPIRMIWVDGANLVNQVPDSALAAKAFEHMEFKVVADAFMTDTALRADLILPSTLMLEEEDVVASYLHEYVHYARAIRTPSGMAKSVETMLSEVGKRLDPRIDLPDIESCLRASVDQDLLGMSLEELKDRGFARTKRPAVAYEGMKFAHADGKYRFPPELHGESAPSKDYPLRFLTLVRRDALHSQMDRADQCDIPKVWVAPDCPCLESIDRDRDVFVVSPLDRLRVRVELMSGLHKGTVVYRRGDWMCLGGGANRLIASVLTDMGTGAAYYDQYVRLENGSP